MKISEILSYIQNRMEEICVEDETQSAPHGNLGYGGPGWDTSQKLSVYASLVDFFEGIKTKDRDLSEEVLVDFFDWFLNKSVSWDYEKDRYVPIKEAPKDSKIESRFGIMEIG